MPNLENAITMFKYVRQSAVLLALLPALAAAEAKAASATPAEQLQVLPGFQVKLLHSATGDEGSWICMAIDDKGSLRLGAEEKPVTVDRLKAELLEAVGKNPQLKLALSADKSAPFGQIIKVMDAAKEAGIKVVNAFTKEAGKP